MSDTVAKLQVVIDSTEAEQGTRVVKRDLNNLTSQANTAASALDRINSSLRMMKSIAAAYISFRGIKSFVSQLVSAANTLEDYRMTIHAIVHDTEEANAVFNRIKDWAALNPVNTDEAIRTFTMLRSSAVKNAEEALKTIANLAAVSHQSIDIAAMSFISLNARSLRRFGISIQRAGKEAMVTSENVKVKVKNDVDSIRAGIKELIDIRYPNAMELYQNTYSGLLNTLAGMRINLFGDLMGYDLTTGPFQRIKDWLIDIRDTWQDWLKTDNYKEFIEDFRSSFGRALDHVKTLVEGLGGLFKVLAENIDAVVTGLEAIAAVKITTSTLALLGVGGPIATAGAVGVAGMAWYTNMQTDKALKKIVKDTEDSFSSEGYSDKAIKSLDKEVLQAVFDTRKEQLKAVKEQQAQLKLLEEKSRELDQTLIGDDYTDRLALARDKGFEYQSEGMAQVEFARYQGRINGLNSEIEMMRKRLAELEKGPTKATGDNDEKLGLNKDPYAALKKSLKDMSNQVKYLDADAASFLPTLEKLQSKYPKLSEGWILVQDTVNDFTKKSKDKLKELADFEEDQIKRQKDAEDWRYKAGLVSLDEYFNQVKERYKRSKDELDALNPAPPVNFQDAKEYYQKQDRLVSEKRRAYDTLRGTGEDQAANILKRVEAGEINWKQAKAEAQGYLDKLNEVGIKGGDNLTALASGMKQATEETKMLRQATQKWLEDFQSGLVDAIVEGENFGDTLSNIGKQIEKMVLKMALFGSDGTSGLLGGWVSGLFKGLFPSAHGNVFAYGMPVMAYAHGGVVSAPTIFPMARGLGLMGEAGPEAVMPLRRTSSGDLGVIAQGQGGGVTVQNYVTVESGGSGDEEDARKTGKIVSDMVEEKTLRTIYELKQQGVLH